MEYILFLKFHNTLNNKTKMKRERRKIVLWTIVTIMVIIVIAVVLNWGSFAEGFQAGGRLAE